MAKITLAISLLFSLVLLTTACKSTKNTDGMADYLTPHEFKGKILSFGSGGGFTGAVDQYTLMEDGQLFQGAHKEGNVQVYDKLDKQLTEQMFNNYFTLGFDDRVMDNPGNMYYFIKMKDGDQTHKLTWGGYGDEKPEPLHQYLMTLYKLAKRTASSEGGVPSARK